jgi:hypothetical protein
MEISKSDLQELLAGVVKAVKEPTALEQKKMDAEAKTVAQAQEDRKKLSQSVLEDIANKRFIQSVCSHEHKNGDSHCVYIQESKGPGYILCQKNQCKIRPGTAPTDGTADAGAIYDTALFNKLFQKLPSNEMFQ